MKSVCFCSADTSGDGHDGGSGDGGSGDGGSGDGGSGSGERGEGGVDGTMLDDEDLNPRPRRGGWDSQK